MAWVCPPFSPSRQGQGRKLSKMVHLTGEGHELIVCSPVSTMESRILREKWLQSQILMGFVCSSMGSMGCPLLQESLSVPVSQKCPCLTLLSLCRSIPDPKAASTPQLIFNPCQNVGSCCNIARFKSVIPGESTIQGCIPFNAREF